MIFVTVGTHEQQFNRLIKYMDILSKEINCEVVIQTGYSTYVPRYCTHKPLYTYDEMSQYMNEAQIIVTHGGPSSFMSAVEIGKVPLVVPRRKEYGEHVNNHQVEFCKEIEKRYGYIKVVDVSDLKDTILNFDRLMLSQIAPSYNNKNFCDEFVRIVDTLMGVA